MMVQLMGDGSDVLGARDPKQRWTLWLEAGMLVYLAFSTC